MNLNVSPTTWYNYGSEGMVYGRAKCSMDYRTCFVNVLTCFTVQGAFSTVQTKCYMGIGAKQHILWSIRYALRSAGHFPWNWEYCKCTIDVQWTIEQKHCFAHVLRPRIFVLCVRLYSCFLCHMVFASTLLKPSVCAYAFRSYLLGCLSSNVSFARVCSPGAPFLFAQICICMCMCMCTWTFILICTYVYGYMDIHISVRTCFGAREWHRSHQNQRKQLSTIRFLQAVCFLATVARTHSKVFLVLLGGPLRDDEGPYGDPPKEWFWKIPRETYFWHSQRTSSH